MPTILITGAAGQIGSMLRTRLARPGRTLRLLDTAPLDPVPLDPPLARPWTLRPWTPRHQTPRRTRSA